MGITIKIQTLWHKLWYSIKLLCWKIMTKFGFGSKNKPYVKGGIDYDHETKQPVGEPYFMVYNSKGEPLTVKPFTDLVEAEAWIENYLVEQAIGKNPT